MTWETISKSIRTNIVIGMLLITPVVITLMIINFLFTFTTDYLVPHAWLQTNLGLVYRLGALLLVVVGLYIIGVLARNFIGRSLYRLGDTVMARIPVFKSIYVAIRRVSESLVSTKNVMFKQVVAIQFPRQGTYAIGFLTARLSPEMAVDSLSMAEGDDYVNVFVPTVPNPTSGFLLIMPRKEIKPLKISVVDAMKMILSVGAVLPGGKDATPQTLLDHLEEWMIHNHRNVDPPAEAPPAGALPAAR